MSNSGGSNMGVQTDKKIGRNDPCPCDSGKKYKKCCVDKFDKELPKIDSIADDMSQEMLANISKELEKLVKENPELDFDELQAIAQEKILGQNTSEVDDFCGLSSQHMHSWLYDDLNDKKDVGFDRVTMALPFSPMLQILNVIVENIQQNGGKLKATAIGNLPTLVVKQANELFAHLPHSTLDTYYQGSREDKFEALHITKILADVAKLVVLDGKHFVLTEQAKTLYNQGGIDALYLPMFTTFCQGYNWGYGDGYAELEIIRLSFVFSLWRFKAHGDAQRMTDELLVAFPMAFSELEESAPDVKDKTRYFKNVYNIRTIKRFMEFMGLVELDKSANDATHFDIKHYQQTPLFEQLVHFDV
jgi:hypothetical protein